MDPDTREHVRTLVDQAKRRKLGLKARTTSRSHSRGTTARRWTEADIRKAVSRVSGGVPITPSAYIEARKKLDPNRYPSYDTVKNRCPDLIA